MPTVESGDPNYSDNELEKIAKTISNDMQFFGDDYRITIDDGCIIIENDVMK